MANPHYASLSQFKDVEALDALRAGLARGESEQHWLELLNARSRDCGRAPFSWDDGPAAGFTRGTPWMDPCADAEQVNAAAEEADPDSVLHFYRALIRARKGRPSVLWGRTEFLARDDPDLFLYTRTAEEEALFSANNFSGKERSFPLPEGFAGAEVLLSNCGAPQLDGDGVLTLRPWEGLTLLAKK